MGKDLKGKELGAGFDQMKSGLYRKRFRYSGRNYTIYGGTLKECKKNHVDILKELDEGIYSGKRKPTLDAYHKEWRENLEIGGTVKGSTLCCYDKAYAIIKKTFGRVRIDEIKPVHLREFQRTLRTKGSSRGGVPYSVSTINGVFNLFHLIMESAVQDEYIIRNPCSVVKHLRNEDTGRTNTRALSKEEKALFLQYAESSFYYNGIRLLFATGMRSGELRGLRWSDYDKKNGVLHIRRTASVDASGKQTMNTPKSKNGFRDIPLNDEIRAIMEDQKALMVDLQGNVRKLDDYVFKSFEGKVMSRNSLQHIFNETCERIRKDGYVFENVSPHSARHTFITEALHLGVNEFALKAVVGHSPSARVTTEVYLDRDASAMKKAMEQMDNSQQKAQ